MGDRFFPGQWHEGLGSEEGSLAVAARIRQSPPQSEHCPVAQKLSFCTRKRQ